MASEDFLPRRWMAFAFTALLSLGVTAGARADEPSAADRETARALMDQGDRAYQAKDFAAALKSYRAAHAIMGIPNTGIWVANAEETLGHLIEARAMALDVARMPKQPGERPQAQQARDDAEKLAERLAPRIPSIVVQVAGVAAGVAVNVKVDGTKLPAEAASAPRKVNPGRHEVSASAPGYLDAKAQVNVPEATVKTVKLEMVPGPRPKPAAGVSPLVFIGFGVGVIGAGVGTITGIMALSKASDARALCNNNHCPIEAQAPIDASNRFAIISDVGFGLGLAGVGLGVVGLVLSGRPARGNHASVRPFIGVGHIGFSGTYD